MHDDKSVSTMLVISLVSVEHVVSLLTSSSFLPEKGFNDKIHDTFFYSNIAALSRTNMK